MADARQLLAEALSVLDTASTLEHYDVDKALEPAGKAAKESGEKIDELRFEFIAVYLAPYDEPNVWGTYYGRDMVDVPLELITPECIVYWTARMNAARHPALRVRRPRIGGFLAERIYAATAGAFSASY